MARLQSQVRMKDVLRDYFTGLASPLAWCTSVGPAELLRALGFQVYFPENHGAMLGASRAAHKHIPRANNEGYSNEICSYLTSDIGAWLNRETPLTAAYGLPSVPRPDLIVFNTNQCREVAEWFNYFGRQFSCPVVGVYPPRHVEEVTRADVDNVVSQFRNLIAVGEQIIGRELDPQRLREAVRLSREASQLWKELLETARTHPAPLTFFDGTILMAPVVMLRGTEACVEFYRAARAELQALAAHGDAAVPGEQARLYWEGMPIWGRLRSLAEIFSGCRSSVVASTYCNSWVFDDFDSDNPLESLAIAYTQIFINRGENFKLSYLKRMIEDYAIDGMLFHDSKTCFNNSNNRFGLPQRLQQETGISTLVIDGDLNDLRFFSDERARTKIETFVEQLSARAV
ncbi:2-hydroxyacyl-CoA dehydratase [candidate division KSB1 bacterium]|nr:2-hydroxyacyl-CoA dehydratase [candidate division KSB1 bacterium]